jgi:small conductance mechanosensitive channel
MTALGPWLRDPANRTLVRLTLTLLVLLLVWSIMWLTQRTLRRSAKRLAQLRGMDDYGIKAVVGRTRPMELSLDILVVFIAAISIMGIWGLTGVVTGLLAASGFAGIIIGLAAADTIGDVIAGFLIFYNHPFDIGDWIEVDGIQGTVEEVGLGATTILTFDNEKVTIPNRIVEGTKVKNFSHARKLRFRIPVGVEYGTHLGTALRTLVEVGSSHPSVLKNPEPNAVSVGFGDSSVNLELRVWVEPVRSSVIKVRTDLVHLIHDRFRHDGINIAFHHLQIVSASSIKIDHVSQDAPQEL